MPGSRDNFAALRRRIDAALSGFLDGALPRLLEAGPELEPVGDGVRDLIAAGKRLRPAFCYWGWRGAGAPDAEGIVGAAAALDLLHACAIVHDDVMDGSDTRRGMPSMHRRFAALHEQSGWHGSPPSFGEGAAILVGDLCLAWSDEMFATCGLDESAVRRARSAYDAMRTEVMAGQYLDIVEQARGGGSVDRAMRVVRYKTAKYTIERPLHIGGLLADAPADVIAAYSSYGLPLGEAFQLRDDLLGVFGDPAVTGKPAGDDLREGKRTVLLATALERATPAQRAVLDRHVGDASIDASAVDQVRAVIEATGAVAELEKVIDALTGEAIQALDSSTVDDEAVRALRDLAAAATQRST